MNTITIVTNKKDLRKILSTSFNPQHTNFKYIYEGNRDPEIVELFYKNNFKEVKSKIDHDQFLFNYVDLIGKIGREVNHKLWWVTEIASKHRYSSQFPFSLYQFIEILNTIKNENYDLLIIFNPSPTILSQLVQFLRNENISFYFKSQNSIWKILYSKISFFKYIAFINFHVCKIYIKKTYAQWKLKNIVQKIDGSTQYYLLKTFIFEKYFLKDGRHKDVYFGSLPRFLAPNKKVLFFANILGNYRNCINLIKNNATSIIIPVEFYLSFFDILKAASEALFHPVKLKTPAILFGYRIDDIINEELNKNFRKIPFHQLLHYWSTKNILKKINVETFVFTYENRPWEKMCTLAIREVSPKTKIIGYQHTVVPSGYANMFISSHDIDSAPLPDKILTTGSTTKKIMERYGAYQKGFIEASCALRFEYLFKIPIAHKISHTGNILIALEASPKATQMVNYVLKELNNNSKYHITIRTHPEVPWHFLKNNIEKKIRTFSNYKISKQPLREDIDNADIVIYWGSTVGLEALWLGKPVIHYHMDPILSCDPLFECTDLKWVVSENDSLLKTLEEVYDMNQETFFLKHEKAKEYLSSYFHPITAENLRKFIE